jgi:hypothetical protein
MDVGYTTGADRTGAPEMMGRHAVLAVSACALACSQGAVAVAPPRPDPAPTPVCVDTRDDRSPPCTSKPSALGSVAGLDARWIAADADAIYVAASPSAATSEVWRVPNDETAPALLAQAAAPIDGMAASNAAVAWTSGGTVRALLQGAAAPVDVATQRSDVASLLVLGERVYWSEIDVDENGVSHGAVYYAPIRGGTPILLQRTAATARPRTLVAGGEGVAWATADPFGTSFTVGAIVTTDADLPFAPQRTLADATTGGAAGLWGCGSSVEYSGPSRVVSLDVASGRTRFAASGGFVGQIDDGYWVDPAGNLVAGSFDPDAGGPTVVTPVSSTTRFIVQGLCLVWLDAASGDILTVSPSVAP